MKKLDISLALQPQSNSIPEGALTDHQYPTFQFEGPEELPIPDHGEMVIHYRKVREVSETNRGQETYRCTIEVRKILGAEAEKDERPSKRDTSAEDSLDKLMKEREEGDAD